MMKPVLGLKLGRRLVGAAALADETFVFHDLRYVSSRRDRWESAMTRYFQTLLEQIKPAYVCYYAPTTLQTTTNRLVLLLEQTAGEAGVAAHRLTKSELLDHFAFTPIRTRGQLRERLQALWPVLAEGKVGRQAVLAEAAAAALMGELRHELPPA